MANLPFTVGLTGGIGSGKTAVSDWFAKQGISVVDADVIAADIVAPGTPGLAELVDTFGREILRPDGSLDRAGMRERVFQQPQLRQTLEQITHPLIRQALLEQLLASRSPYTLLVAPLLVESGKSGLRLLCQRVLVVDVPEAIQQQRAMQRDGQTAEQIERIMAAQISRQARLEAADDVVHNDGSLAALYAQLIPLHQHYLSLAVAQQPML